jgi:hypothetical protein
MTKKLKVVNLFGGPGCGKSTTRAELFALFKKGGHNVEEVTEFAKDLTWEKNQTAFADQLFLLANQNRRQFRLQDQVEWCVTDSPILLGVNYVTPEYLPYTFRSLSLELWNTYENYNYVIERARPYQAIGRNQTEDEAKQIDVNITKMLNDFNIPFKTVRGEGDVAKLIFDDIMKSKKEVDVNVEAEIEELFNLLRNTSEEVQSVVRDGRKFLREELARRGIKL